MYSDGTTNGINTMKKFFISPSQASRAAFSVVEIIIVIVVISILATISIVSYGQWRERVAETEVKSDLANLQAGMESYKNFNNGYPVLAEGEEFDGGSSTVDIFKQSKGVKLSYVKGDSGAYCISGRSVSSPEIEIYYSSLQGIVNPAAAICESSLAAGDPDQGPCGGSSGPGIFGIRDYRTETVISTGSSPVTITMPTVCDGDLVLVFVGFAAGVGTGALLNPPPGLIKLAEWSNNISTFTNVLWWGIINGAPSSLPVYIRENAGTPSQITILSISGARSEVPAFAVHGRRITPSPAIPMINSTLETLSTTPSFSNGIDIRIGHVQGTDGISWTPPTNYSEIIDSNGPVGATYPLSTSVAYRYFSAGGSTGVRNFTLSTNDLKDWVGYTVTIARE